MHHYMSIRRGQICFHFAGSRDCISEFNTEREAAEALVHNMMVSGVHEIMVSSSVDFPEEEGLPEFCYTVFHNKVQEVLDRLHQMAVARSL